MVSGGVLSDGESTFVVTAWYTERAGQRGIVFLNDFTLGSRFGGKVGFREKLKQQGFSKIEVLKSEEEIEAAKRKVAQAPGNWSGPWFPVYPWEALAADLTGESAAGRVVDGTSGVGVKLGPYLVVGWLAD
jgi:hypothetical protein